MGVTSVAGGARRTARTSTGWNELRNAVPPAREVPTVGYRRLRRISIFSRCSSSNSAEHVHPEQHMRRAVAIDDHGTHVIEPQPATETSSSWTWCPIARPDAVPTPTRVPSTRCAIPRLRGVSFAHSDAGRTGIDEKAHRLAIDQTIDEVAVTTTVFKYTDLATASVPHTSPPLPSRAAGSPARRRSRPPPRAGWR
jgi:hypothetical protein